MSIVSAELVWRKSATISDAGSNGGVMSATASTSGVKNNIFPDVPQSERTAGSDKYRKMFIHVANDDDLTLVAPKVFVETRTPGDDAVTLFAATQSDTQSGITGAEQKYGMGTLNGTVSALATTIVVDVEDWANLPIFADAMVIRISDKTDINDAVNNEEYATISGAPSVNVNEITLTLAAGLTNGYTAGVTKVSSVYEPGDVSASADNVVVTGSGSFVSGIVLDSIGSIEDSWTLTFDTATNYTVVGSATGSVGSGTVGGDFSPNNSDYTKPYFTIQSSGFSGTFTASDTITFDTHPASVPVWYYRKVPAGANSLSGNSVIVAIDGESS